MTTPAHYPLDNITGIRAELLTAVEQALDSMEEQARHSFATADPAKRSMMERTGGIKKYDRRRQWWQRLRSEFDTALG